MAYTSYLIQQYNTTHENIFFKKFSEKLSKRFGNSETKNILIGNLSVNGNQIDALFIKNGQITVIDFKNYGGKLTFSENNPWTITYSEKNNNYVSLVAGGAYNRNPYQQVNHYRTALINYFANNENKILQGIRTNVNWGHISAMILFQQHIEFNQEEIPKNFVYFHITDYKNCDELLNKIFSKNLILSDTEIVNLLKTLNINEDNLFDETKLVEDTKVYEGKIKFDLIKRLVKVPNGDTEIERILTYYKILLEIESYKAENKFDKEFLLPFNNNFTPNVFTIDFTKNKTIFEAFVANSNEKFPKNIFVGINFSIGNAVDEKIFFYQIILASEINYETKKNEIELKNFELYEPTLYELNLPDNFVEELSEKIAEEKNLQKKIEILENELESLKIKFNSNLTIAFSNKNLTNSQLISELNRLIKYHKEELTNGIINNYLLKRHINNNEYQNTLEKFINITPLNKSQSEALKATFQNKITIITGPPGTGKTQLVLNIIANAIINNKKILFASKNNKAVDNVTERFLSNYLLRIGSREINETQLKPRLDYFIGKKFSYNHDIKNASKDIDSLKYRIEEIKKLLKTEETLPIEINNLKEKIKKLEQELKDYLNSIDEKEKTLFVDKKLTFELNQNSINFELQKLQNKNTNFISKLFFSIFSKTKQTEKIITVENKIDNKIIDHINSLEPLFENGKTNLTLLINHLKKLVEVYTSYKKISEFISKNTEKTEEAKILLQEKEKQLIWIKENKNNLQQELITKKDAFIKKSQDYLKLYINNKLSKTNPVAIANYSPYINNPPWRNEDYPDYEKACRQFIEHFTAISVTNLSAKRALSLSKEMFDLLVIDEASQCDIASAIPLIFRAKNIAIIGDPHQLKHITSVKKKWEENYILYRLNLDERKYNYEKNSLFDYAKNIAELSNTHTYFLKEHYRCHPKIIEFSNINFYNNELNIQTNEDDFNVGEKGIVWYDVKGETDKKLNVNKKEIQKVKELAEELIKKYPDAEIGITTPFRDQNLAIKSIIKNTKKLEIKTIHKFQGDEKDIIILSLVVTEKAKTSLTNFINFWSPHLLNVAVTRAQSTLYIVGDFNFCKNNESNTQKVLSRLATYVELNGKIK